MKLERFVSVYLSLPVPPVHVYAESAPQPARTVWCVCDEARREPRSQLGGRAARS